MTATPARQFKATALAGALTLFVEAKRGQGRRHFIAACGPLTIRLPIADDMAEDHLLPVMTAKLEARLWDLLDRFSKPKQGVPSCPTQSNS